jgi:hypothetical protein
MSQFIQANKCEHNRKISIVLLDSLVISLHCIVHWSVFNGKGIGANCREQDEQKTTVGAVSLVALPLHQLSLSRFQCYIGKRKKVIIRLQRLRNREESRENYNLLKF